MPAVLKKVILFVFMLVVSFFTFLPFYIMFIMGTYVTEDLFKGIVMLPGDYLLKNLATVFGQHYMRYFLNSLIVAVSATSLAVVSSAMAGFAFAKYEFRFKKTGFNLVLVVMMIPAQLGLIAFMWEMKEFGWVNTYLPLIVPAISSSFGVFWMTQYIRDSVPNEVLESARIDGGGEMRIFFQIVLPFVRTAIVSIALLFFLWDWNSYLLPMLVLSKVELFTIPVFIPSLRTLYRNDYGGQILGLAISTIPVLVMFVVFSQNLIKGLTGVAVKG